MLPAPLQGQTLGKYRVLEALGRGGMAQVYKAYHPQLDRYVAIKVLRGDLAEEEEFLLRFRREAQAVAALRHANIVQVFDFDAQDDVYYMIMELLEGDTLKARLNDYRVRGELMPLGEVVRVMLDALDGLAHAHGEGMIHRDIKPANLMLTRRGQAVITDFGIAQIIGGTRHTASGALMGTLNYIAPEQGLEGKSDARSDIYSLGIVLYEMLTGHTPFDADTPLAILMKHLNDPLPLPRQIAPAIPEQFERIIFKALAKRPEDRYQTAIEMAQALRQAAQEANISLPERISLPLSFTTKEAPAEPVAVLSGTAREKIADAQRMAAADDTDASISERLAKEKVAPSPEPAKSAAKLVIGLRRESHSEPGLTEPAKPAVKPATAGKVVLSTVILIILTMSAMTGLAGLTGRWQIMERGWPVAVMLVGVLLSVIMTLFAEFGLLIPVSIISGTGAILAYFSITDTWGRHWFMWLLEPALVLGPLLLFVWLGERVNRRRWLSRLIGIIMIILNLVVIAMILDTVIIHMAG